MQPPRKKRDPGSIGNSISSCCIKLSQIYHSIKNKSDDLLKGKYITVAYNTIIAGKGNKEYATFLFSTPKYTWKHDLLRDPQ